MYVLTYNVVVCAQRRLGRVYFRGLVRVFDARIEGFVFLHLWLRPGKLLIRLARMCMLILVGHTCRRSVF